MGIEVINHGTILDGNNILVQGPADKDRSGYII